MKYLRQHQSAYLWHLFEGRVHVKGRCFLKLFKPPSNLESNTFTPRLYHFRQAQDLNFCRIMDFDLPPSIPVSGIPWERVLPPLFPRLNGTIGPYSWTPTEFLIPVSEHTGAAKVTCDHNGFTVEVDVKHFSPEELLVKVSGDYVVVEGKHEQKKDGSGLVTRQFNRRYRIPNGVDIMALESAMSPEGMLIISAPLTQGDNNSTLINPTRP